MTIASLFALLQLASSLLTSVQQNPNMPPALRSQALTVAQSVLVYTQTQLNTGTIGTQTGNTSSPTVIVTPVAPTTTNSPSLDNNLYRVAVGGATNVLLGTLTFRASAEDVRIQKIGLKFNASFTPAMTEADLASTNGITLWHNGAQVGLANFTGNNTTAQVNLTTPVVVPRDAEAKIDIRANISAIGSSQPATPGHVVAIDFDSTAANNQFTGVSSGQTITPPSSANNNLTGITIYKSFPTVALDPLPTTGLTDGRLLRFKITANAAGEVSIGQLAFTMNSSGATASNVRLYGYTDAGYSQTIPSSSGPLSSGSVTSGTAVVLTNSVVIPAGKTYYFELRADSVTGSSGSVITTFLVNDMSSAPMSALSGLSSSRFVWSGNTRGTAGISDSDWANGYGLPSFGDSNIVSSRSI